MGKTRRWRSADSTGVMLEVIRERIRRLGPLPFDQFVDLALYHPDGGFYATGGGAGAEGHFLTSPEVGPLFAAVMARALDTWWDELGRPNPYVVVEAAAGAGTLARDVLAAAPACGASLRYLLVERSVALRERQAARLAIEPASVVLGAGGDDDDGGVRADDDAMSDGGEGPGDDGAGAASRRRATPGPLVASLAELPAGPLTGVVFANELLDNLPFALLERGGSRWYEVRVGERAGGGLEEVLVPAVPALAAEGDRHAPGAPDGARVPLQHAAQEWLRQALAAVERGRIVMVDYASTTAAMAMREWHTWVRTYRGHSPGGHPLDDPGAQDVTCEVAVDQLSRVRAPTSHQAQAEFLVAHGLDELVADARSRWWERAATGDLPALIARSRVSEAEALTDPAGLGAFRVLEWEVG